MAIIIIYFSCTRCVTNMRASAICRIIFRRTISYFGRKLLSNIKMLIDVLCCTECVKKSKDLLLWAGRRGYYVNYENSTDELMR